MCVVRELNTSILKISCVHQVENHWLIGKIMNKIISKCRLLPYKGLHMLASASFPSLTTPHTYSPKCHILISLSLHMLPPKPEISFWGCLMNSQSSFKTQVQLPW